MGLEAVVKNFGKGFVSGASSVVDPVGGLVAGVDYSLAGIGPADENRGNNTYYNQIQKKIYSDYKNSQDFEESYVPRALGTFTGAGASVGLGYLIWTGVNPALALAVPIIVGVYSGIEAIKRYAKDFVEGEKIEGRFEKGSFLDGLTFGWHNSTSYLSNVFQPWESMTTGRGYDNSKVGGSTATHAAKGARRNFRSMTGAFIGQVFGSAANAATFLIMPIYKTVRDSMRTLEKVAPKKTYSPSFVSASPIGFSS